MSVSLERFKNTYLPIFHNGEVPIVRLEEETDSEQGEQPTEVRTSRKKKILEWISSLVLTESQKDKAENTIPIIIPLFAILCAYSYYEITKSYHGHIDGDYFSDSDYIFSNIINTLILLAILLIGVPLEVAHGKLKIFCLFLVTIIHCHILSYDFGYGYLEYYDERVVTIALASLHLTNIAMNWNEMEYKVHRFIILLILLGPTHLFTWAYTLYQSRLLHPINIGFSISSTNGIIFGYYWFYGNKTSLFKYVLIIMTLTVIIIRLLFKRLYHF